MLPESMSSWASPFSGAGQGSPPFLSLSLLAPPNPAPLLFPASNYFHLPRLPACSPFPWKCSRLPQGYKDFLGQLLRYMRKGEGLYCCLNLGTHPPRSPFQVWCLDLERVTSECQRSSSKIPSCPFEVIVGPRKGGCWARHALALRTCGIIGDIDWRGSWSSESGKIQLQLL